jgi:hypothetical protein
MVMNREDLNPESRIAESSTFHVVGESHSAIIEVIEPMVQLSGEDELNHAVAPMIHSLSVDITPDDKVRFAVTFDSLGEDESWSPIEIPRKQVQELFDWLKKNNAIR